MIRRLARELVISVLVTGFVGGIVGLTVEYRELHPPAAAPNPLAKYDTPAPPIILPPGYEDARPVDKPYQLPPGVSSVPTLCLLPSVNY
ncbi:MAG: hypothetical protein WA673_02830 [Candidatus Acidiferrales bacterium]